MDNHTLLLSALIIFCIMVYYRIHPKREGYMTHTYTSVPGKLGVTTTDISGFHPYYPMNSSYSLYPDYSNLRPKGVYSYTLPGFIGSAIREEPYHHYSVVPQYQKPMFTSVVDTKDLISGRWVQSGIAYSDTDIVNVYQYAWDPVREIYEYRVTDKDNFIIPLKHTHLLEDGDTFQIPSKGNDMYTYEEYKYNYAYV